MALTLNNLRFKYNHSAKELFSGISYEFEPSSLIALTGPSGFGKSTLLYLLGLMLNPSSGKISFNGTQLNPGPESERARFRAENIGFVFQNSELDSFRPVIDSVMEPGLYVGRRREDLKETALTLLSTVGLADLTHQRPNQISGGQAQRIALCRALMNDPAIILADEPTGNLDDDNSRIVLDLLKAQSQIGRTVIIATHDAAVIDRCDIVFNLSHAVSDAAGVPAGTPTPGVS